jgi:hypothetical protein
VVDAEHNRVATRAGAFRIVCSRGEPWEVSIVPTYCHVDLIGLRDDVVARKNNGLGSSYV